MGEQAEKITAELDSRLTDLPTPVSEFQVRTGLDSIDDPAVWVYVILEKDDVDFETRTTLRKLVRDTIQAIPDPRCVGEEDTVWVYVRFRTASEVAQLT